MIRIRDWRVPFITLILCGAAIASWGSCPLLTHQNADEQREFQNVCQSIVNPIISTGTAQNFTIVNASYTHIVSGQFTNWVAYTPTFSTGFGTVTNISVFWRRVGDTLFVRGAFKCGTTAASGGKIGLPNGAMIDSAKIATGITQHVGNLIPLLTGGPTASMPGNYGFLIADGSNNDGVFLSYQSLSFQFVANNVNALISSSDVVSIEFSVPISGWSF